MPGLSTALGSVCAVIGAQWGDEGKGKIVDALAAEFGVIARAAGGANAGHTIVVGEKKHVFHLLPSGCLHPGVEIVLGAGMVIHLPTLLEEIALLRDAGIDVVDRLHLYPNAHLVFEYHKAIDAAQEERRARSKGGAIGTTKRGIGPAYVDKVARAGLRMEILRWPEDRLREAVADRAAAAGEAWGIATDVEAEVAAVREAAALLAGRVVEHGPWTLDGFLRGGKRVLVEGAQATLLDIDHGTYPHVTSSQTTAAGALQGLGLAPRTLDSCIGVAKAYCTRVGGGPFPTEAGGEAADRLRERGGEYGATTGRPRRCGWLSIPDLRHAALINGIDCWNLTKLDVLDEEEEIPIGTGVDGDGAVIWERLPGWKTSTRGVRRIADLPPQARTLLALIEERTGVAVRYVGTGQGRDDLALGD